MPRSSVDLPQVMTVESDLQNSSSPLLGFSVDAVAFAVPLRALLGDLGLAAELRKLLIISTVNLELN